MGVSVPPAGSATPAPSVAGTYLFTLTCGSGANTLHAGTLAFIPVSAPTTLSASASSATVDAPITLTWNSADNTGICYAGGGDGTAPWIGNLGASGSLVVTSRSVADLTYAVSCNNELAQATVNYVAAPATSAAAPTPTVTLSSTDGTETAGQGVSLTWSSENADSCSATGGNSGDGWAGTLALSGSMTVTETTAGTVTYSITCVGAPPAATASTTVVVVTAAPPASSSHGGGRLDPLLLALLGVLLGASLPGRYRHRSTSWSPESAAIPSPQANLNALVETRE
jgi:hypothetical protein